MSYTYTDPTGQAFAAVPTAWAHQGHVHALAGDWRRAERLGWTRAETDGALAAAQALAAASPDLPEKVRSVVAALREAVSLGVALDLSGGIPGWDEIGQAFATAVAATDDPRPILAVQARAQGAWFHYATKAGSFAEAYRLANAIASL